MLHAPHFWYRSSGYYRWLVPMAYGYQGVMALRRWCYRRGFKKKYFFSVPVVVVGNLTVGGTGKTPLVIWLAQYLKSQGYQPGIVSRGYRGHTRQWPERVTAASSADEVGDEAVLLAAQTQCPVVVARNRVLAVTQLLAEARCDLVITDDGLQHEALGRDIEIAVVDAEYRWGNGHCLPAGPLRESFKRLQTVNFVIEHHQPDEACRYRMQLIPQQLYSVYRPEKKLLLSALRGKIVHAVAAIGQPTRFFRQLTQLGASVIGHAFPDHYFYQATDFSFGEDAFIVMTEKDAVKCNTFADNRLWCLSTQTIVSSEFQQDFSRRLMTVINEKSFQTSK